MRILISADVEGASGIASLAEAGGTPGDPGPAGSRLAQRCLTGDVNAAVEGAMEAGATLFVVHDNCTPAGPHILMEELHPAVEVVRAQPVCLYEEVDLARGYDCAFMIGMHARAGEAALLSQTLHGPHIREVRLNGQPVGEAELTVALAGAYGIPTLLVTGDDRACIDVQRWSGGQIEAAVVKYSFSRYAGRCLPLIEARERIRVAAGQALARLGQARPFTLPAPINLEVAWNERELARRVAWMPQAAYDGDRTVHYSDSDFRRVYRALLAMYWIATSRLNPGP